MVRPGSRTTSLKNSIRQESSLPGMRSETIRKLLVLASALQSHVQGPLSQALNSNFSSYFRICDEFITRWRHTSLKKPPSSQTLTNAGTGVWCDRTASPVMGVILDADSPFRAPPQAVSGMMVWYSYSQLHPVRFMQDRDNLTCLNSMSSTLPCSSKPDSILAHLARCLP